MSKIQITDELLAAFLDGNATREEAQAILAAAQTDAELTEFLAIAADVSPLVAWGEPLPVSALAAANETDNNCSVRCEAYALRVCGVAVSDAELEQVSQENGWLKDGGTALANVGRLAEKYGLSVSRSYDSSLSDLTKALENGCVPLVVVDGGELLGDQAAEQFEDLFVGQIPDHVVVVLMCDLRQNVVTCYNPAVGEIPQQIPLGQFLDAWQDSHNYLISISSKTIAKATYVPTPIEVADVELPSELIELREAIAENTHDVWAKARMDEGWIYGEKRDDIAKTHPDLVPYSDLTDGEKEYDRTMAVNVIKLMYKLGYDLVRRQDTDFYRATLQQLRSIPKSFICPNCKGSYMERDLFCPNCGKRID